MQIHTDTAGAPRFRRWWWLLCALVFAVTAAVQVYLAVSMTAWWAWWTAAVLTIIAIICAVAAQRRA